MYKLHAVRYIYIYILFIFLTCLKIKISSANIFIHATVDPTVPFIQQKLYITSFQTVSSLCLITQSGDPGSLTSRWRAIS